MKKNTITPLPKTAQQMGFDELLRSMSLKVYTPKETEKQEGKECLKLKK